MKGLPNPPTDNIYKFMAISGLWLFVGFVVLYIWLVSVQIQLDKDSVRLQSYYFSVNIKRNIERRLSSIEKKEYDKSRLDWVPSSWSVGQEVLFLNKALENHEKTINRNKGSLNSNTGENLKLFERTDLRAAFVLYVALMVGLIWFGFSRWIKVTHSINEQIKELDRDIKLKTLQKLELEIKQLKLTRRYTRTK